MEWLFSSTFYIYPNHLNTRFVCCYNYAILPRFKPTLKYLTKITNCAQHHTYMVNTHHNILKYFEIVESIDSNSNIPARNEK